MVITVKNCMKHELDSYKAEVCKYAKVKPEAIKIQSIYHVDDALVIRYAYNGMLLAYLNDPNEKPHRSIQFVMTCDNFLGDYLEDSIED